MALTRPDWERSGWASRSASMARATAAGERLKVSGSMSAKSGCAPQRRMELAVAKKLKGVVTTASPGPTPAAASASQSASVPLAQPTPNSAPQARAAAASKLSTAGPRMNFCDTQTASMACMTSSRRVENCRVKSSIGTGWRSLVGTFRWYIGRRRRGCWSGWRGYPGGVVESCSSSPYCGEVRRNETLSPRAHDIFFAAHASIPSGSTGDRHMESKPAQNIQDTFLNTVRKDKSPITIYLVSGVKLTGKIRSFDKYSVLLENNSQEQLIFKHAISTVVSNRSVIHSEHRVPLGGSPVHSTGVGTASPTSSTAATATPDSSPGNTYS